MSATPSGEQGFLASEEVRQSFPAVAEILVANMPPHETPELPTCCTLHNGSSLFNCVGPRWVIGLPNKNGCNMALLIEDQLGFPNSKINITTNSQPNGPSFPLDQPEIMLLKFIWRPFLTLTWPQCLW